MQPVKSLLIYATLSGLAPTVGEAGFGWLFPCHRECSTSCECEEKPRCCFKPPVPPRGDTVESAAVRITNARADRAPVPARASAPAPAAGCAPAPLVPGVNDPAANQPLTQQTLERRLRLLELELQGLRVEAASATQPIPPEPVRR